MGLKGASGVYVIWHAGLRPEWLTTGHTDNLAQTFEELGGGDEILEYDRHGKLFVTSVEEAIRIRTEEKGDEAL